MNLDPRSLSFARICLGLLVFFHNITFLTDWQEFYGPQSISSCLAGAHPSVQAALLAYAADTAIFLVLPLGSICLIFGLFTPISCAACLAASIVLHAQTPYALSHAEDVLRAILLWFVFLPTAQYWSLDIRWRRITTTSLVTYRVAAWAYTFQVCLIYWMAAVFKVNASWLLDGNALAYAFNLEHLTTSFGHYLLRYPELLRHFSHITPFFEFLGPFLLLSPFRPALCRMFAVCAFLFFHLVAIQSTMDIGIFVWVCAILWLPFIPAYVWDYIARSRPFFSRVFAADALPLSGRRRNSWDYAASGLAVVLFMDVLAWNFASIHEAEDRFRRCDPLGPLLGFQQSWRMYYVPYSTHGWLLLPASLADGSKIDLYTGQPVTDRQPPSLDWYLGDTLEKRFLSNLYYREDANLLAAYAKSKALRWDRSHPPDQAVRTLAIVFMDQETRPDLTVTAPVSQLLYKMEF
jgi:hypothetical protein